MRLGATLLVKCSDTSSIGGIDKKRIAFSLLGRATNQQFKAITNYGKR